MQAIGRERAAVRNLIRDNNMEPLRRIGGRRVSSKNGSSRSAGSTEWRDADRGGDLDATEIFASAKIFRVGGTRSGGSHDYVA